MCKKQQSKAHQCPCSPPLGHSLFQAQVLCPGPAGPSRHAAASGNFLSLSLPSPCNSLSSSSSSSCSLTPFRELLKCHLLRKVFLKLSIENTCIPVPISIHCPPCYSLCFPHYKNRSSPKKSIWTKRSVSRCIKPSKFPLYNQGLFRKHKNF